MIYYYYNQNAALKMSRPGWTTPPPPPDTPLTMLNLVIHLFQVGNQREQFVFKYDNLVRCSLLGKLANLFRRLSYIFVS